MKKSFYPVLMCNKIQEEANFFTDLFLDEKTAWKILSLIKKE